MRNRLQFMLSPTIFTFPLVKHQFFSQIASQTETYHELFNCVSLLLASIDGEFEQYIILDSVFFRWILFEDDCRFDCTL